jgi:hypothetical protein
MFITPLLFALSTLILSSSSCPINPKAMPSPLGCVQNIACSMIGNESAALVQHCNKFWYYGTSSIPIKALIESKSFNFRSHSTGSVPSFISLRQAALSLKVDQNYSLIRFDNSSLYFYPLGSTNYYYRLDSPCSIVDHELLLTSNGSINAVILCSNSISSVVFDSTFNIISNSSINLTYPATTLKCLNSSYQCLVGTSSGRLLLINILTLTLANIYQTNSNSSVSLIKTYTIPSTRHKIYVGFSSGLLN